MYVIKEMPEAIPSDLLGKLTTIETATVGHFRLMGFADSGISPLKTGHRVSGTAVTLALPGHDSSLLHHVIAQLRPGDFLVIDRFGDKKFSCFGGGVAYAVKHKGVVGVAIDGPCNDPYEIFDLDFPTWSRGVSPITTRLLGTGGAFNVPISFGGAVVQSGDAVLADDNGVLILPRDEIQSTVDRAQHLEQLEKKGLSMLHEGMELGEMTGATKLVQSTLEIQQN